MPLSRDKLSNIPSDAIILSKDEAIKHQLDLIQNWKNRADVRPFTYTPPILATLSAASSLYINAHYRNRLRLLSYGRFASYLPVVVFPTIVSGFCHLEFVTPSILLQNECPVCLQLRAAAIQAFASVVYPGLLAPAAALSFAVQYHTYDVPPITKQPKQCFEMYKRFTKPIGKVLFGAFIGQAFIASFLTYLEQNSILKVHEKLNEMEKDVLSELKKEALKKIK